MAQVALHNDISKETRQKIFISYDEFLRVFADNSQREHLDEVAFDDATHDETYSKLRTTSHDFREGIRKLFFDEHPELKKLIRDFGVF